MRKLVWPFILACLALAVPGAARAEWREVRSPHFSLLIDDTEENARSFAIRLERFDAALRKLYNVPDDPDQHSRPIRIYALDPNLFANVCACSYALGYYSASTPNSIILSTHMPKIDRRAKTGAWSSQTVLLHEYSHHFAYNNFPLAYPYWFSEGFAEFNATAEFEPDGSVVIGFPANYRARAIKGSSLPIKELLDPKTTSLANIDALYGRGWLLTHLLTLKQDRAGQLMNYLHAVNRGVPSIRAAEGAFGDLNRLNAELNAYARGELAPMLRIAPSTTPVAIGLRTLSPGEAAMLPVRAAVESGLRDGGAKRLANRAAGIARRYPADTAVQLQWAQAELHAERLDHAAAAVDIVLSHNATSTDALNLKGEIAVALLLKSQNRDPAAWAAARNYFQRANRLSPNAVLPLYNFYRSYVLASRAPPQPAVKALMRAQVLAPESSEVRQALARQMLFGGDSAQARTLLQPLAFKPHRRRDENVPKSIIQLIDAGRLEEAKKLFDSSLDDLGD